MLGWFVVAAAVAGLVAVVRRYMRSGGTQGYSTGDREAIERMRVQKLQGGGHSHGGAGS